MFRHFAAAILFFSVSSWSWVHGAEVDEFVRDVLKAHAKDTASLKKQNISIIKATGVMTLNGEKKPNTRILQSVWPAQTLVYFEFGNDSKAGTLTMCAVNDRGWRRASGFPSVDLTLEEVNDYRQVMYSYWMITLLPLTETGNKFSFVEGIKVNGEQMKSILVSRRNWPDVTLSFDPNTYLLRKVSYKARDNGVAKLQELYLNDHKEIQGIKLPQSISVYMEGKELFNWSKFEYVFPEKIDKVIFEKQ